MAGDFTQANSLLKLTTPLGKDELLATHFTGHEGISQLFSFHIDALSENRKTVAFDKLLVQPVTIEIAQIKDKPRFFNGIVRRVVEGKRGTDFTEYRLEVVPQVWILTKTFRSRHFQHMSVPDILKKVLTGVDVKFEISGTFLPRRYAAQYRESDFDFASRIMEEEGIYYYFQHANGSHKMIVSNAPSSHCDVPIQPQVIFEELEGGNRPELRVASWSKSQEIRSGKYTLWDHCFEMPQDTLASTKTTIESVMVGKVTHKLKVGGSANWEIYEYPGGYAEHFDGISKSGGAQPGDLKNLFKDNDRTAAIRMQQETLPAILIRGISNCGQFTAGHKFELKRHHNADGKYVLTSVLHNASNPHDYSTGGGEEGHYENQFTCIPMDLPFVPPQTTPRPTVQGVQLAFVVGPPGEEISCDKYGRVKVQFHWDREGKVDADSSCWLRVSNNWGGAGYGGNFVPHVGQEVIVSFEEGDPDKPIIVGRVYNAESMPPLGLPGNKTKSVLRDQGNNAIIMEGKKGEEQVVIFSPKVGSIICMGAKPPALIPTAHERGTGSGGGAGETGFVIPPRLDLSGFLTAEKLAGYAEPTTIGQTPDPLGLFSTPIDVTSGTGGQGPSPPPPTPPAPPSEESGLQILTNGLARVFVGADSHNEVLGNWHGVTVKNKFTTILGFKTDVVKGYEKKHVFGFTHTTIAGWKADIIGGYKDEFIVGKVRSFLGGLKLEVIKGNTTKLHSGKEYKHEKNGKGEKSMSLNQMRKDVKTFKKAEKDIVDADKKIKVGGKAFVKAVKIQEEADEMLEKATNNKEIVKALKKLVAGEKKEKMSGDSLEAAANIKKKASEIVLAGKPVKLG